MNRLHWFGIIAIGILCSVALLGCGGGRPAVPTVALAPTEPVVIVVVTATSQPTLAPTDTAEPFITPLPDLTEQVTGTVTATVQAEATKAPTRAATRPPATVAAKATAPAATSVSAGPAPTAASGAGFPAPQAIGPEGGAFKNGNTIKFQFGSVGQLASNECYRVDMTLLNPAGVWGVSDYWVGLCGDQSLPGTMLNFQVGKFRDMPNYSSLLANADAQQPSTPQYTMQWTVTVVRITDNSDPIHPKTEPISPPSRTVGDSFFRS